MVLQSVAVAGRGARVVDFDEWVAVRGDALFRLAYVLTGNRADAEDVVQDALSRALPRWSRIVEADDPDAYVRRMVVNAHTSWWRRFRRREAPVAEVRLGESRDPDVEEHDRVWRACLALPPEQRVAVVLRYYERLDYTEMADLTGVREGTLRSRVSRGLAALRATLEDDDG
jgi:RNA polymerase sigma-70 factor (sigma-E family)